MGAVGTPLISHYFWANFLRTQSNGSFYSFPCLTSPEYFAAHRSSRSYNHWLRDFLQWFPLPAGDLDIIQTSTSLTGNQKHSKQQTITKINVALRTVGKEDARVESTMTTMINMVMIVIIIDINDQHLEDCQQRVRQGRAQQTVDGARSSETRGKESTQRCGVVIMMMSCLRISIRVIIGNH